MKSLVFVLLFLFLGIPTVNLQAQTPDSKAAATGAFADKTISLPTEYVFDKSVKMELITSESDAASQMKYVVRYHDTNNYIGMVPIEVDGVKPNPEANMMMDFERMQMVTFMTTEESKMALVYGIPESKMLAEGSSREMRFEKTGEEKEMFDYFCFEYAISNKEFAGTVWVAPELEINIEKSFEALGLQFEIGDDGQGAGPNGFIMEFDLISKSTGERTKMNVLDIDLKDAYAFPTEGYVATSMAPAVEEAK